MLSLSVAAAGTHAAGQSYRMTDLSAPGVQSQAYAINSTGEAAGWVDAGSTLHGARWQNDQMADIHDTVHLWLGHGFNTEGFGYNQDWAEVYDISDADQLVGGGLKEIKCGDGTITIFTAFIMRPATNSDFGSPVPGDALTDLGTWSRACILQDSAATAINNKNIVVGWADADAYGTIHAFLVRPMNGVYFAADPDGGNALMVDLGTLSGQDSVSSAHGINDNGYVTGYSYTAASTSADAAYHCFLIVPEDTDGDGDPDTWFRDADADGANDLMADLGTLGGTNSWGRAINDAGVIVGESDTASGDSHAFMWQSGAMSDLGTLGGNDSSASAINASGQIVGWAENSQGERRAVIWENGQIRDLNDLISGGSTLRLTEARDINDNGEIVGWGVAAGDSETGERHAFRLAPSSDAPDGDDPGSVPGSDNDPGGDAVGDGNLNLLPLIPDGQPPADDGGGQSNGDGSDAPPAQCAVGLLAVLPFIALGMVGLKAASRRTTRR